jgi:hypothetical protein
MAAVAFLAARYESYDRYYEPTRRRFSDHGFVSGGWIWPLCAVTGAGH